MKFNADSLFEAIEVQIGGVTHTVQKVTQDLLKQVADAVEQKVEDGTSAIDRQLGVLLGADSTTFSDIDTRVKNAAVRFITETVSRQLSGQEVGNVPGVVVSSSEQSQ